MRISRTDLLYHIGSTMLYIEEHIASQILKSHTWIPLDIWILFCYYFLHTICVS